jgi:hypothetical protein
MVRYGGSIYAGTKGDRAYRRTASRERAADTPTAIAMMTVIFARLGGWEVSFAAA